LAHILHRLAKGQGSLGPDQELTKMSPAEDRRERLALFVIPALIVVLGCSVSLLPPAALAELLICLTAWTGLSIPLAMLIGHCVLSED
jgi:hypothetical protein